MKKQSKGPVLNKVIATPISINWVEVINIAIVSMLANDLLKAKLKSKYMYIYLFYFLCGSSS